MATERVAYADRVIGRLNELLCKYTESVYDGHIAGMARREAAIAATQLSISYPNEIRLGADFDVTVRVYGINAEYQALDAAFTVDGVIAKAYEALTISNGLEFTVTHCFTAYDRKSADIGFYLTAFDGTKKEIAANIPISAAPPPSYRDINGHWAESSIEELTADGVFQGFGSGYFRPSGAMSRAMFVATLYRAAERMGVDTASGGQLPFGDAVHGEWYYDYAAWAYSSGIVEGIGGHFRPNDAISREQAVTMLHRFLAMNDAADNADGFSDSIIALNAGGNTGGDGGNAYSLDGQGTADKSVGIAFSDYGSISNWAYDAVLHSSHAKLILGYGDGSFRPTSDLLRADAATILYRLLNMG